MKQPAYRDEIAAFTPLCAQEAADREVILSYIDQFPNTILTRENRFAHIACSGILLNERMDRILMIYHNIYQTWSWTGGHADGDDRFLNVAIREAREETGIVSVRPLTEKIVSLDVLPVWGHFKRGSFVSSHQHLEISYVLIADENDSLTVKPDENSGVKWFDTADIPFLTKSEPYMEDVYMRLINRARLMK